VTHVVFSIVYAVGTEESHPKTMLGFDGIDSDEISMITHIVLAFYCMLYYMAYSFWEYIRPFKRLDDEWAKPGTLEMGPIPTQMLVTPPVVSAQAYAPVARSTPTPLSPQTAILGSAPLPEKHHQNQPHAVTDTPPAYRPH